MQLTTSMRLRNQSTHLLDLLRAMDDNAEEMKIIGYGEQLRRLLYRDRFWALTILHFLRHQKKIRTTREGCKLTEECIRYIRFTILTESSDFTTDL